MALGALKEHIAGWLRQKASGAISAVQNMETDDAKLGRLVKEHRALHSANIDVTEG